MERTSVGRSSWMVRAGVGVCLMLAGGSASLAEDWPQFLGPTRNGKSAETKLIDRWPADGLKVVWRAPGGVGMSGVSIAGGRAITLLQRGGKQQVVALDARTGKPLWNTELGPEYKNAMGDGPRATPAIAGDRLFVFTGDGTLAALDVRTGKKLWSQATVEAAGGKEADYGMACSPIVVGDQVIVTVGAAEASVVSYDVKTGERRWAVGSDPAGYSSPALLSLAGQNQLVVFNGAAAVGVAPATGKLLWRFPFATNYECNIATPIVVNGDLFLSAGENHGSVLLKFDAKSDAEPTEVWSSLGPKSVLRSEWQTPILLDGHLYGMDNVGGAGPITHLTCVDAKTGERKWQQARYGKGNFIYADGKLFLTMMTGEVVVVRPSPDSYQELGRMPVLGSTRQAPALADGLLYVRDDKEIVCLDVKKP